MDDALYIGTNGYVASFAVSDGAELWRTRLGEGVFSTPGHQDVCVLQHGGRVFAGCFGHLFCLDAATGEIQYEGGRVPKPARFMGSPVAYAGLIALTSEDGDTYLLKAGPKHEIVGTNSVGEPVYSSPAISNGRLYIRGHKHLFAIGK